MKTLPVLLLAFAAAAPLRAEPIPVDSVVASVNGDPVLLSDVKAALRAGPFVEDARRALPPDAPEDDVLRAAFAAALADLEDRKLIVRKYREGELRMPDFAVDRAAAERVEKHYGGDLHALQLDLAREGMTYSEWKDGVEENLIVTMMRQTFVNANVHVSPGDVARAWETNRAAYVEAPRVRVAMAAFPAADTNAPAEFRARLSAGERFEWLVSQATDEQRRLGAGDYGWIDPAAKLAPAFADAVAALPDGGVGEVVLGETRYLVARLESEKRAVPTLAETWERIEEDLWSKASDALYRSWIASLRDGAAIREFVPEELR